MGGGTQLATDAVTVGDDLEAVAETLDIAASAHRRVRQNLGRASATTRSRSRWRSPGC